jgi:hypothetical protein
MPISCECGPSDRCKPSSLREVFFWQAFARLFLSDTKIKQNNLPPQLTDDGLEGAISTLNYVLRTSRLDPIILL